MTHTITLNGIEPLHFSGDAVDVAVEDIGIDDIISPEMGKFAFKYKGMEEKDLAFTNEGEAINLNDYKKCLFQFFTTNEVAEQIKEALLDKDFSITFTYDRSKLKEPPQEL